MKLISLFSGIGGFELAAEWMGWTPVVSCEINPFGRKVLEHYWPQAYHHTDIKTLTYEKINEELTQRFGPCWRSDDIILTGGFPCQPYSMAGKRLGKEDDRHLWPEMLRIIREVQPTWIVGENVFGLVNWNGGLVFHEVQTDLEAQGYEVQPYVLPACAVNAPHRRDRVWFVAYRETDRLTFTERTYEWEKHQPNNRDAIRTAFDTDGSVGDAPHPNDVRLQQCENGTKMGGGQAEVGRQGSEFTNAIETDGTISNAPHPNGNGLNGSDCEHEVNPSQGGEYAQRNIEQMGRDADDPENVRSGKLPNQPPQPTSGHPTNKNHHSDPDEITPNTSSSRRKNRLYGTSTNEQQKTNQLRNTNTKQPPSWHNFPTVSPLRSRNDGVSYKLDGITFSKWRNESIKAAGNAIVPQVALQIFKAIEKYHQLV